MKTQQPFLATFFYHLTMGLCCKPAEEPFTPLMQASLELERAQFDLLEHTKLSEYHNSTKTMLEKRITRLRVDISKLSTEATNDHT